MVDRQNCSPIKEFLKNKVEISNQHSERLFCLSNRREKISALVCQRRILRGEWKVLICTLQPSILGEGGENGLPCHPSRPNRRQTLERP